MSSWPLDRQGLVRINVGRYITSLAFSPDGKHIVTGGEDGVVQVWDVVKGAQVGCDMRAGKKVCEIAVSRDGRWIVGIVGDGSESAIVWDARTREAVIVKTGVVPSLDVSPDSRTFATGAHMAKASIWDISRGWKLVELKPKIDHFGESPIVPVKFSPQADRIATVTETAHRAGRVSIFDSRSGNLLIDIPYDVGSRFPVAWSIDGRYIFASLTGSIQQFDAIDGSLLSAWRAHKDKDPSATFSKTGAFVACSTFCSISLWDTSTRIQLGPAIKYLGSHIVLSSDNLSLAYSDLKNIVVHNIRDVIPVSNRSLAGNGDLAALSADFFVQCSKVSASKNLWEDALHAAEQAIARDPSSLPAYECKRAALCGAACYDEAIETQKTIFSVIQQSSDSTTRELLDHYVHPSTTEATIRKIVQSTLQLLPRVLIDATSGRLHDKNAQAASFEMSMTYKKLVSEMTTSIDRLRIEKAVSDYFRYVMLSHNWNGNEPLFQSVENISIYDLEPSSIGGDPPAIKKLQKFAFLVQRLGFIWFWSDTCCIDKRDNVVMQESLVLMFTWYRGSALTLVYLRGVHSPSKEGQLVSSPWNTRGWTYQEYVAAETIQFYDEDWTPYLSLPIFDDNNQLVNHKMVPAVRTEMEQVVRAHLGDRILELRPGRNCIREKLCLASTRQTTRIEDEAYSLFGIFLTSIDVKYGEGEEALGRFLAQVLMSSADTSILAWTGQSSSWNSCMPARITVFKELATSHLPSPVEASEMDRIIAHLRTSTPDLSLAMQLYDRLSDLGAPWFAASRMRLPCITFRLGPLRTSQTSDRRVYRAMTVALGVVEFTTKEDLSYLSVGSLYLAHPWINHLLDRGVVNDTTYEEDEELGLPPPFSDEEPGVGGEAEDHKDPPPTPLSVPLPVVVPRVSPLDSDKKTRALHLLARLRQPFSALLFRLRSGPVGVEFQRVASDCLIKVQVQENVEIHHLIANARVLDVL